MPRPAAPSQPPSLSAISWRWRAFAVAVVAIVGVAIALDQAAAGDPYGDGIAAESNVSNSGNVLGASNGSDAIIAATGSLTVSFLNNALLDGPGDDLTLHLANSGDATAEVFVSANGTDFVSVGTTDDLANASFDVAGAGLPYVTHVRIDHDSGGNFDVDALEAEYGLDLDTTIVTLSQDEDENPGFTDHTVTAHVEHMAMVAVEGVTVSFAVAGQNDDTGADDTDGSGDAQFTWNGDGGPGPDMVVAWLDLNDNGEFDAATEPYDTITKTWHGFTGLLTIIDVDGGGLVDGDLVEVLLVDLDENADPDAKDTVLVHVESDSDAGFDLLLTETGNNTGEFVGHFDLGTELSAAAGETVTATYIDALNGEGEVDQEVEATIAVVDEEEDGGKVTICHRPPGNPGNQKTLEVGGEAHRAHIAHGDVAGACGEPVAPTKAEQAAERRDERNAEREAQREERDADFCDKHGADHPRCGEDDGEE